MQERTTCLIENHLDSKLIVPGNLEQVEKLDHLVDINLAINACSWRRLGVVDHAEDLVEEVHGFRFGQSLVGVSVQLKLSKQSTIENKSEGEKQPTLV